MPNDVVSIAKLVDVASEQLVKVKAQVLSISGPKVINTQHQGTLRKQDVTLRDTATSIKLVLWDHYVDSLEANKTYLFENVKLKSNPTLFGTCEECKTWQNLDFCDRQWMHYKFHSSNALLII
ncbi:hypothetical protein AC249_AIPGENE6379 [Exaiptasia diaphana]|nr:hypothetical protein AC249_AIPGENE6379 [Exaiptasia diaphana]